MNCILADDVVSNSKVWVTSKRGKSTSLACSKSSPFILEIHMTILIIGHQRQSHGECTPIG